MDFKMLLTTFGLIFLAELGDKTQLATFCFSADCDSRISVFLGAAGALVLSSLIAVFFGAGISNQEMDQELCFQRHPDILAIRQYKLILLRFL